MTRLFLIYTDLRRVVTSMLPELFRAAFYMSAGFVLAARFAGIDPVELMEPNRLLFLIVIVFWATIVQIFIKIFGR